MSFGTGGGLSWVVVMVVPFQGRFVGVRDGAAGAPLVPAVGFEDVSL